MRTGSREQTILAVFIAAEIILFSFTGTNFISVANFFECIRLAVEIGLLALALTPVIVTGGIDLSVGSMMGLCAVCFGALTKDAQLPTGLAVIVTLVVSFIGGLLNGYLIARLKVSALIVTLGTYSLFREIAEAITGGARNFSDFSPGFLFFGQGYLGRIVPPQALVLLAAAIVFWLLLERTVIGRAWYAIGHSDEAARYAGIPVAKRVMLAYVLSGVSAGLAGVIYIAHLGQAKSDAGTGYELTAITAVVLGGTSIFGGVGTIAGSLLGLAAIVILQNGLRLSAWPAELAGIATGVLLVLTIALQRLSEKAVAVRATSGRRRLATVIGAVALLSIAIALGRTRVSSPHGANSRLVVGVMPKAKGDPYFISCRKGAEKAARELNVDLIWDGPTGLDAAKQNEVVEGWITRHVDAISVAVENAAGISTVLRKARAQGIKIVTWDADAEPDSRDYFVNQATPKDIGYTLIDEAAKLVNDEGEFAIITGALSAANQNQWIAFMREHVQEKYPKMKLLGVRPSDDDRDKAFQETQTLLKVHPAMKVVIAISAPAVPGAGEAVKQSGRTDVSVVGLSLPNLCKPYVRGGSIKAVVLWKTEDLGYLAVDVPTALARGKLRTGATSLDAGYLGKLRVEGSQIILGKPFVFRKDNIEGFDF
ncbi:MAG: substrate-binding domain-containing protein [Acidobacteriaceae bacterium]|nr:substrate-binding domain-containing protein [Acidobacteriaceae bacterium]